MQPLITSNALTVVLQGINASLAFISKRTMSNRQLETDHLIIMTLTTQWTIQQHRKSIKRKSKSPLEKVYGHSESHAGVDAEFSEKAGGSTAVVMHVSDTVENVDENECHSD